MTDSVIVPAPGTTHCAFLSPDFEVSVHLVVAFHVTGQKAEPVFWPSVPRGAKQIQERFNRGFELDGMRAESPEKLAALLRGRVQ